ALPAASTSARGRRRRRWPSHPRRRTGSLPPQRTCAHQSSATKRHDSTTIGRSDRLSRFYTGLDYNMARARATAMRPRLLPPAASEITHTRFLVSAERLFCVHGYEGTKIRAIATLSNANLGMLSHYWGSKRALFREVFERRLQP